MDMNIVRSYWTPAVTNELILRPASYEVKITEDRQSKYWSGVEMLLYFIKYPRLDISNSVRDLSKVNNGATKAQWSH